MPVAPDQQVLQHRRMLEQFDVLEGARDPEFGHAVLREAREVAALEQDAARGRRIDESDQVEDRGLAGAVRPDNGVDLAALQFERDAIHGHHAAETNPKILHREEAHLSRSDFM